MGAFPLILAAAGTVGSSVLQARGARAEAESEAQAAEYNRVLSLQQGRAEAARIRRAARRELSSQRVAFAKAGVRIEGSPLELLAQNAAELEADALNAEIGARNTAEIERRRARNLRRAGRRRAASALIGGVTRLGGLGIQFGTPGRPSGEQAPSGGNTPGGGES